MTTFLWFKKVLSVIALSMFVFAVQAQTAYWNYTVTGQTKTLPDTTGSTTHSLTSGSADDGVLNLAWPFGFMVYNDSYTTSDQVSINTNGFIRFDATISGSSRTGSIPSSSTAYGQFISYGGNTDGRILSDIKSIVTGTTPNQIWTLVIPYKTYYSTTASAYESYVFVSFYEGTNQIKIQYSDIVTSSSYHADYLGINAGDGVYYNNLGLFPDADTAYFFDLPVMPALDATISQIFTPSNIQGNNPISCKITNLGTNNLSSCTVNWSVNGVNQTPYSYTGNLGQFASDSISVGTFNFNQAGNQDIVIWTSSPNNGTDANTSNDTNSIQVVMQKAKDAGITNILVSGTTIGNQSVKAIVKNYGTSPLTAATIQWAVGGVGQTAYNFNGNILQNNSDTVTLGNYNFATAGSLSIDVWTVLAGDEDSSNDSASITHSTFGSVSIPYSEGFENGVPSDINITFGSQAAVSIVSTTASQGTYSVMMTGKTSSSFTGGSTTTATNYSWSNTLHRVNSELIVNAVGSSNLLLNFDMKQTWSYGAGYSNFRVLVNGNPISDINGTITHQPSTQNSDPFTTIIYNLNSYAGTVFTLSFQSECKYDDANNSGDGDNVFIDNVKIMAPILNDAGLENAYIHNQQVGATTVALQVKNWGASNLTTATINWTVDGVSQTPFSYTGNITQYSTDSITIGSVTLTAGQHVLKAWSSNPNGQTDGDNTNDTILHTFMTYPPHSLPLTENFENGMMYFDNQPGNNTDFVLNTNLQSSGSYSAHNAYGNGNDNYLFETGSIDLSTAVMPSLHFKHIAKTEGGYDKCYVQISTDGGNTYVNIPDTLYNGSSTVFITKDYFDEDAYTDWGTSATPAMDNTMWKTESFDLSPYNSATVRVRFYLHSDGSAVREGWYIDDIQIKEAVSNDIATFGIIPVISNPCGNSAQSVSVVYKNMGATNQTNVPVKLIISGATSDTLTSTISLLGGEQDTVIFGTFNASNIGVYTLTAISELSTDADLTNDTLVSTFEVFAPIATPYLQDFEGTYSEWNTTFNVGLSHGNSTNAMYTNLWSLNTDDEASVKYKFNGITTNSILSFDYVIVDYSLTAPYTATVLEKDSIWFSVSTDCGATYTKVYQIDSNNHIVTDQMAHVEIPLSAFAGQQIMLKINGQWNVGDYFLDFDNIGIYEPISVNIGNDTTICDGASLTLVAGNDPNKQYLWSNLNGDTLGTSMSLTVDTSATYIVKVSSSATIFAVDSIIVNVVGLPVVSFSGLNTTYCETEAASSLTGLPTGGVFSGAGILGNSFDPAIAGAGTHQIEYTYTDSNMCSSSSTQSALVGGLFNLTTTTDQAICEGQSLVLEAHTDILKTDLMFSEYIEGSSNNKAIELYNGTSDTLNLDNYRIAQATNGNGWQYYHNFPVGATLAPGDVWVIVTNQTSSTFYDTAQADEVLAYPSVVHHNGDDARGLEKTTDGGSTWTLIDIIGDPNNDPGTAWSVAGVSNATANYTLIRKISVAGPDTSWTTVAGTDSLNSQYLVYPQNYFSNLGTHGTGMLPVVSYLWSTSETTSSITVNPTTNTQYIVTVSEICSVSDTINITVNPNPVVAISAPDTNCREHNLTLDATSGFTSYLWSTNDTTNSIMIAAGSLPLGINSFSVVVENTYGCFGSDTVIVFIADCSEIEDPTNQSSFSVYPNPSNGLINIEFSISNLDGQLSIYNTAGKLMESIEITNAKGLQIDMTRFAKGVYYLQMQSQDNITVKKLIIQ
ncbi:MAG: lamin tail domain-containing protein [Bacteroidales bacterium]|nr:lamin tail domain-containing protein [Bacteroidales bacterium]